MKTTPDKLVGVLSILLFTFGITYLDFHDLGSPDNLRPYLMLVLGVITLTYWLIMRARANNK